MLVVVGGHSRNIGKTSVMANLIRAIPEANWTAAKITQFGHGICSKAGKPCHCADIACEHPYSISQEQDALGRGDSCRFLAAGARRSYWIRTSAGQLGHAMPAILELLRGAGNAIFESNSILEFVRPDLYIVVLDPAVADFKASTRRYLERADALVWTSADGRRAAWEGIESRILESRPTFTVNKPDYASRELNDFVRARLCATVQDSAGKATVK